MIMWPRLRLERLSFVLMLGPVLAMPWLSSPVWRGAVACLLVLSAGQAWRRWQDLQAHERVQREALAVVEEGVVVADADYRILDVNAAMTRASGYTLEEVRGWHATRLSAPRHDAAFFERLLQSARSVGRWEGEFWHRRKSGGVYPAWLKVQPRLGSRGELQGYVCVLSPISSQTAGARDLRRIGFEDALTGLPNRRRLHELLGSRLSRLTQGECLDLALVDIDGFRAINEGLGSETSDRLLVLIGQHLNEFVPNGVVGRSGGNQFMLLRSGGGEDHDDWIQRLQAWMATPFALDGRSMRLGATIGSCQAPTDGMRVSTLRQCLETALFSAKRNGRNHALRYSPGLGFHGATSMRMVNDLRSALAIGGQLELHFQPQYRLANDALTGLEVLLRWRHPHEGLILPADFIPMAETHGLMASMGNWVIDQTLAQMACWRDRGQLRVPVWVNVSPVQLFQGKLEAALQAGLARHRLEARYLGLELTESTLLDERAGDVVPRLEALRERGHPTALDDFGTGYSSLGYLTRLPLDKLKLDRTFVESLPEDRSNIAIVNAVLAMAEGLSLKVVAEGVETLAQRDFLRAAGCGEAQGYWYSPPRMASEI
ncbi:EAL domain-containing protein [Halomonas sp. 18H]|nr:GGDEF domain-containing phosphodiesterase [Halomonas sp. 18H]MCW4149810.1 EAL domain-containing protein [Halomonas sp. 18H]